MLQRVVAYTQPRQYIPFCCCFFTPPFLLLFFHSPLFVFYPFCTLPFCTLLFCTSHKFNPSGHGGVRFYAHKKPVRHESKKVSIFASGNNYHFRSPNLFFAQFIIKVMQRASNNRKKDLIFILTPLGFLVHKTNKTNKT